MQKATKPVEPPKKDPSKPPPPKKGPPKPPKEKEVKEDPFFKTEEYEVSWPSIRMSLSNSQYTDQNVKIPYLYIES